MVFAHNKVSPHGAEGRTHSDWRSCGAGRHTIGLRPIAGDRHDCRRKQHSNLVVQWMRYTVTIHYRRSMAQPAARSVHGLLVWN